MHNMVNATRTHVARSSDEGGASGQALGVLELLPPALLLRPILGQGQAAGGVMSERERGGAKYRISRGQASFFMIDIVWQGGGGGCCGGRQRLGVQGRCAGGGWEVLKKGRGEGGVGCSGKNQDVASRKQAAGRGEVPALDLWGRSGGSGGNGAVGGGEHT